LSHRVVHSEKMHSPVNLDEVFSRLATSSFRSRFRLGPGDARYLQSKGLATVLSHARDFINRRLSDAQPVNDGKQTPFRGHPAFVAQHATATCCRACLSKWHRIGTGTALSEEERVYVLSVIERWLRGQMDQR
jgi:hypothetical protein